MELGDIRGGATPSPVKREQPVTRPLGTGPNKPASAQPSPSQQLREVAGDLSKDETAGLSPLPKTPSSPPSGISAGPVELVPGQKERVERAKAAEAQLYLIGKARHPEQVSHNQQTQASLERDVAAEYASKEKERLAVSAKREQAQREWKASVTRDFSAEQRQFAHARKNLADSRASLERSSPGSKEEVDAHLRLCERLTTGGLTEEAKEKLRREVESSEAALVKRLNKPGQNFSKPPVELQKVLRDHDKLLTASNFPKNAGERQAWSKEKTELRDQTLVSTSEKLRRTEKSFSAIRDKLEGAAATEKDELTRKLTERYQQISDKERTVQASELPSAVRQSSAFSHAGETGRITDRGLQGVEFLQPDGQKVKVTSSSDGSMNVEAERPGEKLKSYLTPAGDGRFTELTLGTKYRTSDPANSPAEGEVEEKTSLRKDANGKEIYRSKETFYPGGRRSEETRTEKGVEITEGLTFEGNTIVESHERTKKELEGRTLESEKVRGGGREIVTETETFPSGKKKIHSTDTSTVDGKKQTVTTDKTNFPNGHSRSLVETERDGVKTTLDTTDAGSQVVKIETKEGHGETTITEKVNDTLVSKIERRPITPQTNVPGLNSWIFSHNPQKLVERLGNENFLGGESEYVRHFGANNQIIQEKRSTKLISPDGNKELLQTSAPSGDLWQLREKNKDGTWNSQTFFQGTRDTIIKKERIEGEFHVQEERSNTEELAKKNNIPSKSHGTQHISEAATVASVTKLLGNHRMGAVQDSDCYREFMRANGDGKLKVLASTGSSTRGGTEIHSGNLLLESADGARLLAVYDAKKDTYVVSQQPRGSEEPTQVSFLHGENRLEIGDGGVRERTGSGGEWKELALNSVEAAQDAKNGVNNFRSASDILHRIAKSKWESGALLQFTDSAAAGRWSNRISGGLGSGAAALQGLALAANWANGDIEGAVSSGGKLGTNVAEVIKLSNETAWKAAATGGRAGWLARSGRLLGVAGMAVGAVEAGKDLSEGKYVGGGLKVAATTGSAYALLGASSFAGPVGWGIAGGATLAGMAWDHNEKTLIADLAL